MPPTRLVSPDLDAPRELPRFVSLEDFEPAEVTITPAANQYGGGAAIVPDLEWVEREERRLEKMAQSAGWSAQSAPQSFYDGLRILEVLRDVATRTKKPTPTPTPARVVSRRPARRESHGRQPGHRRPSRSSARSGDSGDSDSDGPGEAGPPARRRVVVDSHYCVVELAAA